VFVVPLGVYIPAMDLVMVRYRYSQSRKRAVRDT
jgi:hypothetical protein